MGKRSDKPKIQKDKYYTPKEAIAPLLLHLLQHTTFDEPCAGNGTLVSHLEDFGHFVGGQSDIDPDKGFGVNQKDALDITVCEGECFITNPPYTWKILDPIIKHLASLAPTWLLLPADMMHNIRMAPHMAYCEKVVSVGRVKWFGNTSGMENSAWYLFDKEHAGDTKFFARCVKAKNI